MGKVAILYICSHPALNNWISNYTITFPSEGMMFNKYAVIPHGCATLVFSFHGNKIFSNLFDPATRPIGVGGEANRFRFLFIVEFQPAGYYAFSGMPQNELTDTVIPSEKVNLALNRLMAQQVETAVDIPNLITEMDRLFLTHLKTAFYRAEFSLANQMIIKSSGAISVKELSQDVFTVKGI